MHAASDLAVFAVVAEAVLGMLALLALTYWAAFRHSRASLIRDLNMNLKSNGFPDGVLSSVPER